MNPERAHRIRFDWRSGTLRWLLNMKTRTFVIADCTFRLQIKFRQFQREERVCGQAA